jgi:hypothetical protein
MEALLMLQPFAETLFAIAAYISFLASLGLLGLLIIRHAEDNDDTDRKLTPIIEKLKKIFSISIIAMIPLAFFGNAYDMFKNQMIYKIATSETTAQVAENIGELLEKAIDKLEDK